MLSRVRTVRSAKITLLFSTAVYFSIVVFNNLTDYPTNYEFVKHVLAMDSIFPSSKLAWRAFTGSTMVNLFYWIIILWETAAALFCWLGVIACTRNFNKDREDFDAGIRKAIIGLALGMNLWLFAFITVGGEWFAMWQSTQWNGTNDAFRMFVANGIVMSFLMLKDEAQ